MLIFFNRSYAKSVAVAIDRSYRRRGEHIERVKANPRQPYRRYYDNGSSSLFQIKLSLISHLFLQSWIMFIRKVGSNYTHSCNVWPSCWLLQKVVPVTDEGGDRDRGQGRDRAVEVHRTTYNNSNKRKEAVLKYRDSMRDQ